MPEWSGAVVCPRCGGTDTRFVGPRYEMSVYECQGCGCSFEIEEEAE